VVINCAGLTSVEMCEANPAYAVSVNEKFPASLAFLSKRQSFRFVHISTDHFLSRPFDKRDETCEFTSINIYGKTKLSADQHILKSECAALICRTNFVGFSFKQRVSYFNWLVSRLCEKEPIFAFDDVFFTPIGIGSLCEYIRLLLESSYSGILNVAGVESISKYDFALMVRSRLQSETLVIPKSIDSAALVQRPKNLSLDTSKLQKMFPDKRESLEFVLDELVDDSFLQYFKI
jgi:dTDP-4-dehydrorhamnose reductase